MQPQRRSRGRNRAHVLQARVMSSRSRMHARAISPLRGGFRPFPSVSDQPSPRGETIKGLASPLPIGETGANIDGGVSMALQSNEKAEGSGRTSPLGEEPETPPLPPRRPPTRPRKPPIREAIQGIEGDGGVCQTPVQFGLRPEVKRRMVTLFAQFQGVSAVQRAIKAEFGLDLDVRTVAHYDAGKPKARVGRRLRELYAAVREHYVGATAEIGIAQQNHRLRLIERLVEKAETAKDFNAATKLLELAAREMGGVLTNVSKTRVEGVVEHRHLSVEDARAELAARLGAVIDGGTLLPAPDEPSD